MAVPGQRQAFTQVGVGLPVGGVGGLEPGGYEVELVGEPILLFEQVEGQGAGVVGLETDPALVLDAIALDCELVALGLSGGVQGGQLIVEHPEHGGADVGAYLDGL